MKEQEIASFFDQQGAAFEDSRYDYMPALRSRILRQELQGSSVLDVGCNCGHLIRQYVSGQTVVGIDLSLKSLVVAGGMVDAYFVNASASRLPFRKGSFDSIICSESLYYLSDPAAFLSEARPLLRPGGKMIIVSSNSLYIGLGQTLGVLLRLVAKDIATRTISSPDIVRMLHATGYGAVEHRGFGVVPVKGMESCDVFFSKVFGFTQLVTARNLN